MRQNQTVERLVAGQFTVTLFLCFSSAVAAQDQPRDSQDILWRADQGAGQLADPGHSRFLPPLDGEAGRRQATDRTARVRPAPNQTTVGLSEPTKDNVRLKDWWKEDAEQTVANPDNGPRGRGVSPRGEIIQSTQILSMVGSEPILAGDLLGRINELLKEAEGKISEEELDKQRWLLMERMLPSSIEAKLVYLDFIRRLEEEQISMIRTSVFEQFDEKQLPSMVESAKLSSPAELDESMRSYGSSLGAVRRSFFEQVAAREMIRKHGQDEREVAHDDLLEYYEEHSDEYEYSAKTRWERLTVTATNHGTNRDAYKALASMGNAVLRGAHFEVVARRRSDGPRAQDGGRYDWTNQGSLASEKLDQAIFALPVGVMSDIIEDEFGFHIVRVVERKEAGRVPFLEAQVGIRDKIKEERRDDKVKAYLKRLKRETYVWNYFSDETQVAGREKDLR